MDRKRERQILADYIADALSVVPFAGNRSTVRFGARSARYASVDRDVELGELDPTQALAAVAGLGRVVDRSDDAVSILKDKLGTSKSAALATVTAGYRDGAPVLHVHSCTLRGVLVAPHPERALCAAITSRIEHLRRTPA